MAVAPVPTIATRLSASLSSTGLLVAAAGVLVVPASSMENLAFEVVDPGDARQFRHVEHAAGHDHEAGANVIAAIGADPPALESSRPSAAN